MTHELKLQIEFCDAVLSGDKSFEIRFNDRGYQKGDKVVFKPMQGILTAGHEIQYATFEITYVMNGWGLKNGYVVFGIRKCEDKE